jgi:hypothetical protein
MDRLHAKLRACVPAMMSSQSGCDVTATTCADVRSVLGR